MNSLLNELNESIKCNNEEDIIHNLEAIVSQGKTIELTSLSPIEPLFQQKCNEILILAADAIAEIAKSDENRKVLTDKEVTSFLLSLFKYKNVPLTIQSCRALGNICFENESARELIGKDGLKTLISVITFGKASKDAKLQMVACGFMLNLLMGNDDLQKAALEYDILNLMKDILNEELNDFEAHEDCCTHILLTLNMLTDHMIDTWLSEDLCSVLVEILKISKNPEISVICLEIIHGQLENNDTKLFLAKKGICELVYELVEKYKDRVDDEESRAALKMACDIIVLVLTGDEPMDLLYNNGNGIVYKNMLSWLNSDDFDLLSTGILAIGNFARNDFHCTQMVQNGIAKSLLDLLEKHNTIEKDIKVQHAILSALRNLVILPQNKGQILHEGLVRILYPMLNIDHSHVTFKLLGTLRIVIDGQDEAALDLIMRKDLLEKLVEWCFNSDHLGVRGEASRLLAWLIKNCHSTKPYPIILSIKDCVKCLVEMIPSNHAVMQNEAFYALNLLCVDRISNSNSNDIDACNSQNLDKILVEAEISKKINFLINKYKEKLEPETVVNLLTLIERLIVSPILLEHLKDNCVGQELNKLVDVKKFTDLHDKIKLLSNTIDSG
ncbi:hypothetical protein ILUMI_22217 [Ignelater luminosus]|uniref:Rap1 GTPase-GDP dissociation stimulator 1-B n=1 Tax=Ignelater luminosus TaxID=2038154 RepID=A0A8K0CB22_IGNLU|nr:hypothetical protein ILUMI_22217 [Ignelater luminosus]